ncbi:unnamed protein product, partial [Haemonchus placei]|uniref:Uncharacterized protein n=1 Tax=Haemonchus placei TaxID=6290 RepID=A0A0N4VV95_HAEPC
MEQPSNSISDRVRHRRFLVLDRHKQSQPQRLDDSLDIYSPRSVDSLSSPTQQAAPIPPQAVAIQVEDEDGFRIEDSDLADSPRQPSSFTRGNKEDDVKSQLSFIMKERLHTMAKEVQRRTSAVRESLIREIPEDSISATS